MSIPPFIVDRLKAAHLSGEHLAETFTRLAQIAEREDCIECAINLEYVQDTDRLTPGDFIPMVTLSLQRQQVVREPIHTVAAEATTDEEVE